MITEHASVVLTEDIAASGLQAGDVGVVVQIHREGASYEVEFMTLDGGTLAIETLEASQVREAEVATCPMFGSALLPDPVVEQVGQRNRNAAA
jgi:hypothetical protein